MPRCLNRRRGFRRRALGDRHRINPARVVCRVRPQRLARVQAGLFPGAGSYGQSAASCFLPISSALSHFNANLAKLLNVGPRDLCQRSSVSPSGSFTSSGSIYFVPSSNRHHRQARPVIDDPAVAGLRARSDVVRMGEQRGVTNSQSDATSSVPRRTPGKFQTGQPEVTL